MILRKRCHPLVIQAAGNSTLATTDVFNIELGGLSPGTQFERLTITGITSTNGAITATMATDALAVRSLRMKWYARGLCTPSAGEDTARNRVWLSRQGLV